MNHSTYINTYIKTMIEEWVGVPGFEVCHMVENNGKDVFFLYHKIYFSDGDRQFEWSYKYNKDEFIKGLNDVVLEMVKEARRVIQIKTRAANIIQEWSKQVLYRPGTGVLYKKSKQSYETSLREIEKTN